MLITIYLLFLPVLTGLLIQLDFLQGQSSVISLQIIIYGLSILVIFLLYFVKQKRWVSNIGFLFLLIGQVVWFAGPALIQILSPNLWFGQWTGIPIDNIAIGYASLLISIFFAMNGVGYFLINSWYPKMVSHNLVKTENLIQNDWHRLLIMFGMFFLGLLPYIIFGNGMRSIIMQMLAGRADKTWALSAGNPLAYQGSFMMTFYWLSKSALVATSIIAGMYLTISLNTRFLKIVSWCIFLLSTIIVYLDQGTRSYLLIALLPTAGLFIINQVEQENTNNWHLNIKVVFSIIITGVIFLIVSQLQLYYRQQLQFKNNNELDLIDLISPRQQSDFFTETAYAVNAKRNANGKNLIESPMFLILVNPIPRALWPAKPKSDVVWFYTLYRWNVDIWEFGGNALPSVVGQYYLIAGWIGVVWGGILFGLLAFIFQRFFHKPYREYKVIAFTGFAWLLVSYRLLGPGFHYTFIWLLLIFGIYAHYHNSQHSSVTIFSIEGKS